MNKKSILGLLAVVMIAAVAAFNVSLNSQKEKLSDLAMENVEALASEDHPLGECVYEPGAKCELLHPTDPDQDQSIRGWKWPQ